jgi:hypothetical protein
MRMTATTDFGSRTVAGTAFEPVCVVKPASWQVVSRFVLRMRQSPAHDEKVGQRRRDLRRWRFFASPLDHPEGVLNLGADARLSSVDGFDPLIDPLAPAIAPVGEVSGPGSRPSHRIASHRAGRDRPGRPTRGSLSHAANAAMPAHLQHSPRKL